MTRYKDYFDKMLSENKDLFDEFSRLHDRYALNKSALQEEFNKIGQKVLEIVHEYENRLCANTERGIYSNFSATLAEKFQNEVRQAFPLIDHIGLKADGFTIKKINLS
jgi:sugar-specific transcriptional regulator TrmB